jgi:hypothetical protein
MGAQCTARARAGQKTAEEAAMPAPAILTGEMAKLRKDVGFFLKDALPPP